MRVAAVCVALGVALCALLAGCRDAGPPATPPPPAVAASAVLARFTIREPIGHRFRDELVHFDVDAALRDRNAHLTDATGAPVLSQVEGGRAWTVLSLDPDAQATVELRAGPAARMPDEVTVEHERGRIVLANDRVAISIPDVSTSGAGAADVTAIPAPIGAIRRKGGAWTGEARWTNGGAPLAVERTATEVTRAGAVLASVTQRIRFADGTGYEAVITLGARQDAALVEETCDAVAPEAAIRLSLPGPVLWQNQGKDSEGAPQWAPMESAPAPGVRVGSLRPWSFWWLPRMATWAGFPADGGEAMVGVLPVRPSRWTPDAWVGFERTEIPVTAGPGGRIDLGLALAAARGEPLHREWAYGAFAVSRSEDAIARVRILRQALVKLAEFPLDEVKGWGFDAAPKPAVHPFLILRPEDVARARRQARTSPVLAARVRDDIAYIKHAALLDQAMAKGDPAAIFHAYAHHGLFERLPEVYLATGDAWYGRALAGAVAGMARHLVELFMEQPARPSLGAYGPWFSEDVTRMVLAWDLVADLIPPEQEAAVRRALVLGAHVLAHPDYWNHAHGLCSANPNMTSSIVLPLGLTGLALAGHPEAGAWVKAAEDELAMEVRDWISPGGAWIENPSYQSASLDGMFLLAQALRGKGRPDPFADPRIRETLDYFGFILTPPDRRFAPPVGGTPMVLPSIGHAFAGFTTPFNGWMAAAAAGSDATFSARQQFFWKRQAQMYENAGRAKGFVAALTDTDLPEAPPTETGRAFPGFGAVLRSSWTDPAQSYVAHRTGPNVHHYEPGDPGSFVYYAKGAPLCVDWGNLYEPVARWEPRYHNGVSFEPEGKLEGESVEVRSLPGFAELSHGRTWDGTGASSRRHLLMVESEDPLGPTYLVLRDHTEKAPRATWNLFCLANEPRVEGSRVHFPGQLGVDLDVHVLSPAGAAITTDAWSWKQRITTWGAFSEEQHGIHVPKEGSREDFFTVLYPRAPGERAPEVHALAGGAAARVAHGEGVDVVLLSPGHAAEVREGEVALRGEIAFARRSRRGAIRLAVVAGAGARAEVGGVSLESDGPAAIEVVGGAASGVGSGAAHEVRIALPRGAGEAVVRVDGGVVSAAREGRAVVIALPAGTHRFTVGAR